MKKILLTTIGITAFFLSYSQFSIRVSDTNANAVDILYNAGISPAGSAALGNHPVHTFQFALQIPMPLGDEVVATWQPGTPLASLTSWLSGTGIEHGMKTFTWYSVNMPNFSLFYNFPASEIVLGTVVFSSGTSSPVGALVNAIDYQTQEQYGGITDAAYWLLQIDPTGTDVANYSNLFYQSAATTQVLGSAVPTFTTDGTINPDPALWPVPNNGNPNGNQRLDLLQPLPIHLLSFDAVRYSSDAKIDWSAVEKDEENASYELYRSIDGRTFEQIAVVKAKNEAQALYTYYDMDIAQYGVSQIYYQLYVKENSGNVTKSEIKTIQLGNSNNANVPVLNPNPTKNDCYIDYNATGKAEANISIVDALGRVIKEETYTIQDGMNKLSLNLDNQAAGVYYIHMNVSNETHTFKLVKD